MRVWPAARMLVAAPKIRHRRASLPHVAARVTLKRRPHRTWADAKQQRRHSRRRLMSWAKAAKPVDREPNESVRPVKPERVSSCSDSRGHRRIIEHVR